MESCKTYAKSQERWFTARTALNTTLASLTPLAAATDCLRPNMSAVLFSSVVVFCNTGCVELNLKLTTTCLLYMHSYPETHLQSHVNAPPSADVVYAGHSTRFEGLGHTLFAGHGGHMDDLCASAEYVPRGQVSHSARLS